MKRLVVIILAMCLLTGVVQAADIPELPTSGTCGPNAKWQFYPEIETLLISGTGPIVYTGLAPWYNYGIYNLEKKICHVIIGEGITAVPERAFPGNHAIQTAYIADTVETLGESTFSGCFSLEKVYIGNRISAIEQETFSSCFPLHKVALPAGVHSIGMSALGDSNITKIIIPEGITALEEGILRSAHLTGVTIPHSVRTIRSGAFKYNKDLRDVYFTGTQEQWKSIVIDETEGANDFLLDATMHYNHVCTWDEGVVSWEATCESKRVKTYTCTVCGGTRDESEAVKGHLWNEGTVLSQPDCTNSGKIKRQCVLCGEEGTADISAAGHKWDTGVMNADTTVNYTCTVCAEKKTEGIPVQKPSVQEPEKKPQQSEEIPSTQQTEETQSTEQTEVIQDEQQTEAIQNPQQTTPIPKKSFLWVAVLVSAGIVLAGGAGALLWWKRKKQ